jgi:hypothetical protein
MSQLNSARLQQNVKISQTRASFRETGVNC